MIGWLPEQEQIRDVCSVACFREVWQSRWRQKRQQRYLVPIHEMSVFSSFPASRTFVPDQKSGLNFQLCFVLIPTFLTCGGGLRRNGGECGERLPHFFVGRLCRRGKQEDMFVFLHFNVIRLPLFLRNMTLMMFHHQWRKEFLY